MPREPRNTVLLSKVTETNNSIIRQAAAVEEKTVSTFLQDAALAHAAAVLATRP